jgi:hypothetical protein
VAEGSQLILSSVKIYFLARCIKRCYVNKSQFDFDRFIPYTSPIKSAVSRRVCHVSKEKALKKNVTADECNIATEIRVKKTTVLIRYKIVHIDNRCGGLNLRIVLYIMFLTCTYLQFWGGFIKAIGRSNSRTLGSNPTRAWMYKFYTSHRQNQWVGRSFV